MNEPAKHDVVTDDIAFYSDGVVLRGWFRRPTGEAAVPTVLATHGLASTIDFLDPLADALVAAGFGVAAFDHRSLGRSDGEPRQEVDPWRQVQDMRNAITYLAQRADVDAGRIGVWGASMGGGVAVTTAALDTRVRAVVGVSLVCSGWHASQLMTPEEQLPALQAALDADRLARMQGAPAATVPTLPELPDDQLDASTDESVRFVWPRARASATFRRYMTLRSLEYIRDFEPLAHAHRIGSRAVLLVVASDDRLAPVADAKQFLESVPGPNKAMHSIPGGHYVPLGERLDETAAEAIAFYREHLQ
jgi:alpha-beta hydrolase superfamily lysophospholipase